jgi:hypothetical protein
MTTGTFHSKVAGVSELNSDGSNRQKYINAFARSATPLILKREPNNPYDSNAVAVWLKARALLFFTSDVQIGYLSAEVAGEIARYLDKGGTVSATITEVTGGGRGKPTRGVNILIQKS